MTALFQKLFRKEKPVSKEHFVEPDTVPLSDPETTETEGQSTQATEDQVSAPPQLLASCGQSSGQQRDHNEDALFTLTTTLVTGEVIVPFGFYVVADGMGGHQHGEIASAMAVRAIAGHVIRKLDSPMFSLANQPPDELLQEVLQDGVAEAHRSILRQAPGGGTTLTAVLVIGDQMTIAHVGDSRAYIIHDDRQVEVITRDHSLVKRLIELGQLTPEEAATHPQRNVLYRAIGQGEPFEPDIHAAQFPEKGHVMICSDGLWGVVDQDELVEIICTASSTHEACQKLTQAANKAGGPDNISVVLIKKAH